MHIENTCKENLLKNILYLKIDKKAHVRLFSFLCRWNTESAGIKKQLGAKKPKVLLVEGYFVSEDYYDDGWVLVSFRIFLYTNLEIQKIHTVLKMEICIYIMICLCKHFNCVYSIHICIYIYSRVFVCVYICIRICIRICLLYAY